MESRAMHYTLAQVGDHYTDPDNRIGHWPSGWLNGEWKCPKCGTTIGRNLKGQSPFTLISAHKCQKKVT